MLATARVPAFKTLLSLFRAGPTPRLCSPRYAEWLGTRSQRTLLYCIVLYCIALHCIVVYYILLYHIISYCILFHYIFSYFLFYLRFYSLFKFTQAKNRTMLLKDCGSEGSSPSVKETSFFYCSRPSQQHGKPTRCPSEGAS